MLSMLAPHDGLLGIKSENGSTLLSIKIMFLGTHRAYIINITTLSEKDDEMFYSRARRKTSNPKGICQSYYVTITFRKTFSSSFSESAVAAPSRSSETRVMNVIDNVENCRQTMHMVYIDGSCADTGSASRVP